MLSHRSIWPSPDLHSTSSSRNVSSTVISRLVAPSGISHTRFTNTPDWASSGSGADGGNGRAEVTSVLIELEKGEGIAEHSILTDVAQACVLVALAPRVPCDAVGEDRSRCVRPGR